MGPMEFSAIPRHSLLAFFTFRLRGLPCVIIGGDTVIFEATGFATLYDGWMALDNIASASYGAVLRGARRRLAASRRGSPLQYHGTHPKGAVVTIRSLLALTVLGVAAASAAPRTAVAQSGREIVCESLSGKFDYCEVNTRGSVRLVRQMSDTKCLLDRTWGFDERGIWVDRGCRGRFALGGSGGGGWQNGDNGRSVVCESRSNQYEFCRTNTRGDVRMRRQLSKDPCIAGRTWGFQRDGIWVVEGCRAEFEVGYYNASWENGQRLVTCESEDGDYRRCRTWTYGEVRVVRTLSQRRCNRGRNWGFDNNGIWVNDGCRAIFAVGADQRGGGWGSWAGGNSGGAGGTGGGWNGTWSQLRTQAISACESALRRGNYGIVRNEAATRGPNDDVDTRWVVRRGPRQFRISCEYKFRSSNTRIGAEQPIG
jgi:hypothetical protein